MGSSDKKESKTYDDIKRSLWAFLTHGPLFYLTVPLAVLALVISFLVGILDGGSKLAFIMRDLYSEKTSYLSKHELEVLNEWVALIDYADSYEQAVDKANKFSEAYRKSKDGTWDNNILFVRDPEQRGRWAVVVDIWPGASSCNEVRGEIETLWKFSQTTREMEDTLGMWIYNSRPLEFRLDKFEKTYGRVTNPPDLSKHVCNPKGECSEKR